MYRQGRPEKTRMIRWRMVSCSNAMQDTSCEICMEEKHRLTVNSTFTVILCFSFMQISQMVSCMAFEQLIIIHMIIPVFLKSRY